MPTTQTVKIIKRHERERLASRQQMPEPEPKQELPPKRDIFETITSWIEEQRQTREALYQQDMLLLRTLQ